jgi:nucleotide-binding universal stress UspA family protein
MASILIATDGSDFALRSARRALELLGRDHRFTVMSVVHPPLPVGDAAVAIDAVPTPLPDPDTESAIEKEQRAEAERALETLTRVLDIEAEHRIEHGDAAAVICRTAETEGFDLIVIGSHGSGFFRRVLMGSVSHHVLHHAPCPVLVLRETDEGD